MYWVQLTEAEFPRRCEAAFANEENHPTLLHMQEAVRRGAKAAAEKAAATATKGTAEEAAASKAAAERQNSGTKEANERGAATAREEEIAGAPPVRNSAELSRCQEGDRKRSWSVTSHARKRKLALGVASGQQG